MNKVDELVEWVAMEVAGHVHIDWDELSLDGKEHCCKLARKILSHPDLALIVKKGLPVLKHGCHFCLEHMNAMKDDGWKPVIPLGEALEEKR